MVNRMIDDRFSSRYGVGLQKQQSDQHEVPRWVRGEFEYIFHKCSRIGRRTFYDWLRPLIWKITGERPKDPGHIDNWGIWGRPYVQQVINECDWWEFFEICEYAHAVILEYTSRAEDFKNEINKLFAYDLYGSYVNCLQCGHHLSEAEEESLCYQTPSAGNVDWRMAVELEVIDDVLGIDAEALTTEG